MLRDIRILALVVVGMLTSACAFTAQQVSLNPAPQVAAANVGGGRAVFINAVDERPSRVLGHRAVGSAGAEITAAQDIASVIGGSLADGLRRLGFKPITQPIPGGPELRVEIRNVDYLVAQGFWAGGLTVDVALKGICITGGARPYERLYRGHHEESIQVVQSEGENETYINSALTRALEEVLGDVKLTGCLAGG